MKAHRRLPKHKTFDPRLVDRHRRNCQTQGGLGCIFIIIAALLAVNVFVWAGPRALSIMLGLLSVGILSAIINGWRCPACGDFLGLWIGVRRCPHCGENLYRLKEGGTASDEVADESP